jgi:hypothetical protein
MVAARVHRDALGGSSIFPPSSEGVEPIERWSQPRSSSMPARLLHPSGRVGHRFRARIVAPQRGGRNMRQRVRGGFGIAVLSVLAAAALFLGACSSTRSAGEQIDDNWILTKVKSKLTGDGDINPFNIDVDVLDGVVTLSGKVKKEEAKEGAERHAESTKGVKQVINKIEVEP